jgi:hypothetical protein
VAGPSRYDASDYTFLECKPHHENECFLINTFVRLFCTTIVVDEETGDPVEVRERNRLSNQTWEAFVTTVLQFAR